MTNLWIDKRAAEQQLEAFFRKNKSRIQDFGSTVNQTFEAFVFASVLNWYTSEGWSVNIVNPASSPNEVKLKFNTRGMPERYSYAVCEKDNTRIQVRHGLRVATFYNKPDFSFPANVVLDVAVINDRNLSGFKSNDFIDNIDLITFGEAKHMSAFAELIANFLGLVHEIKPDAMQPISSSQTSNLRLHPVPFLYVSGHLYPTARGVLESIKARNLNIDVFDHDSGKFFGIALPLRVPTK
jgi:hypothetical protein